ncbi:MAG: hypothetical protein HQ507_08960 [Candidatus Marinimicrobia bacterium]|nr:hypothetical protein [Candidatus Neomarinimicrobiota bacterium]
MKLSVRRAGLAFMLVVASLGILACGSHYAHHGNHQDRILKKASKSLDLNTSQQAHLKEVLETMSILKEDLKSNHAAMSIPLKANLAQRDMNLDELNGQFDKLEMELSEFRKAFLVNYAEFHASLNDDQRAKVVTLLEKLEKRHRD